VKGRKRRGEGREGKWRKKGEEVIMLREGVQM